MNNLPAKYLPIHFIYRTFAHRFDLAQDCKYEQTLYEHYLNIRLDNLISKILFPNHAIEKPGVIIFMKQKLSCNQVLFLIDAMCFTRKMSMK